MKCISWTKRDRGPLPTRVGGGHYLLTRDNVELSRSALLDGPWVGVLRGGHMYRCLELFRRFASGMEGGALRGDHYLAGTSHCSGQTSRPHGW